MKKQHLIAAAALIAMALPLAVFAEDSVNVSIKAESGNGSTSATVREKIRSDYQTRIDNMKANQDYRNDVIRERIAVATSSRGEIKDIRNENRTGMRLEIFKIRQSAIVRELSISVQNLKQIEDRIKSRITKAEQSGRNMTSAKAKLAIADQKITAAVQAIATFAAYVPPVNGTSTTTADVNLDKPRKSAADAIKAVKSARDSLRDAVVEIAHSMGFKLGHDNDGTGTTTSPTPPIASTTPTGDRMDTSTTTPNPQ